jgi:hypothetical protein
MKLDKLFRCQSQLNKGNCTMLRLMLTFCALLIVATPAAASSYSAKLTTPASQRIIGHDIVWTCGHDACQGATDESRPAVICQSLARSAGKVDSFFADSRAFTPAELAKCNAAANVETGQAIAAK